MTALSDNFPIYEPDDGPLTAEQIAALAMTRRAQRSQ